MPEFLKSESPHGDRKNASSTLCDARVCCRNCSICRELMTLVGTHERDGDIGMLERLAQQIPKILQEKNCSRVKIDVAVEDGKVRLKAWAVKE